MTRGAATVTRGGDAVTRGGDDLRLAFGAGVAWLGLARTVPVRDASLVAIMSPKGLAAVVLASMPLEQQIREGAMLQSITYSVVFLSIVLTSLLSFLIERTILARFYALLFRGFGSGPPTAEIVCPTSPAS